MAKSLTKQHKVVNDTKANDTSTAPLVVFLMSLVPFPLCLILNAQPWMQDPRIVLVAGVVVLIALCVIAYMAIRRMEKPNFILYVMPLFMFACMIDLIIALEADHILSEFMTFYLKEGEPYLWTSYGTMINYWDGIGHYAMCLWILFSIYKRQSYHKVGLYWVGSITNSLLVLVPGSMLGTFGVKWAILLNLPYFFVPVWIGFKLLTSQKPAFYIRRKTKTTESVIKRPLDLVFVTYFLFAAGVDLFRGFIALGCQEPITLEYLEDHEPYIMHPLAYPKVQMLIYMFYFVPYYACAIYGLFNPGQEWMPDWALLYAGAAAQGQFSHIGASFHSRTDTRFHVPQGSHSRSVFWLLNISLFLVPQVFALYQNIKPNKGKKE